jgi:hypothetical protein
MHIDPLRQNSLGVNLLPHPLFPALYESHPDNTGVSRSSVPRAPPADFLRDITQKVCSPASSVMRDGTPGRKNTVLRPKNCLRNGDETGVETAAKRLP